MTSSLTNLSKSTVRSVKNYTKGYSDVQTKVRSATSNDPWGPSGTQMNEIAQFTYNQQDFVEIMEMLDKRLNDKGKNWRHVFKALTVLDYCLHAGSENVVLYFRENLYIVKTLKEFQYIDEDGKDQGANVRQKAKDITNLLQDEGRLRDERKSRSNMRDRMSGRQDSGDDDRRSRATPRPRSTPANGGNRREDDELARAMELSKRSAEEDAEKARRSKAGDADLEEAMRLSREEDERRRRELENARGGLFDQDAQNSNQLIDFGSSNDAQLQPQFSAYNPYADAAAAMQRQQEEEYMRMQMQQQQQLEYQRQLELQQQQAQQQAQYQQMLQQQAYMQQMQQQQQFQPQPLVPQQTSFGSNNPFASFASSQAPPPMPAQASQQTQPAIDTSFSSFTPAAPSPKPSTPAVARPPRDDGQHAKLAALIGSGGDGIDTFGNIGSLRVPVGSPFHPSNRVGAQPTGNFGGSGGLQSQPTGFGSMPGAPARGQFGSSNQGQQQQQAQANPFFDL